MASLVRMKSVRWAFNCREWKPSESDLLLLSSSLQKGEKERIGKFVYQRDAKFAMAGRLITRKFVVDVTGLEWKDVNIERDERNKPYFAGDLNVQFNLSHAGDYVVFSGEVGDLKLGVDVMSLKDERHRNVPEFFRLMTRLFSDDEWRTIRSYQTESDQMDTFFRHWCLKEGYTKALGTGISLDLKRLSFKFNTHKLNSRRFVEDTEVFVDGVKQTGWLFQEMLLDGTHSVAVAIQSDTKSGYSDTFSMLKCEDLIENIMQITPPDVEYCKEFMNKEIVP